MLGLGTFLLPLSLVAAEIYAAAKQGETGMRTPHKWTKEIHAFAEGFDIESRRVSHGPAYDWLDDVYPNWFAYGVEFRIKTRHQAVKDEFEAGAEVEFQTPMGSVWDTLARGCPPAWHEDWEYRIKERIFPVTSLSREQLYIIWHSLPDAADMSAGFKAIANAAIKQYILDKEKK